MYKKYDHRAAEARWRKVWAKEGVYEPKLKGAGKRRPFYNLMMFPYPSAEGLHIGAVRTYTGVDIYGRYQRMQGRDVFQPMGLDGFGIHSENFALKVSRHPSVHAKISEKNFYRQLDSIGNGFAWDERLETYDPEYYKWTQWIFTKLFKAGLAYRKKQAVNWCPSCKTVLANEQVEDGKCERCKSIVEKRDLEQWSFRITKYAERLLQNLDHLDWTERIKLAQKNWIGKSEGAEIDFGLKLPAYTGDVVLASSNRGKLKRFQKLCKAAGFKFTVRTPEELGIEYPDVKEDGSTLAENAEKKARALADKTDLPVLGQDGGLLIHGEIVDPVRVKRNALKGFKEKDLSVEEVAQKMLDYYAGIAAAHGGSVDAEWHDAFCLLTPEKFTLHGESVRKITLKSTPHGKADPYLPLRPIYVSKITGKYVLEHTEEEELAEMQPMTDAIKELFTPAIKVFTTRPDTLFGATYLVLAPEHPFLAAALAKGMVSNQKEIEAYIRAAKVKSEEDRIAEGQEKTGVELKGVKAVNPATKEEISVWVADYVLGGYGTGAIMAVPAHDERDWEFAAKFKLSTVMVVCPHYPAKTCPILTSAYTGEGHLVSSGKFDGMPSEKARWEISKAVGGERKIRYRLRDWLISRQRYWGPPIPMIFCETCAKGSKGEQKDMPGWYAVPDKDLPVKLPYVKDFQPRGTGESPLATVKSFYEVKCPACKSKARRETDVSDTFLDSAWYYLRYPNAKENKRAWDPNVIKKWFPVDMYIGGPEHAVLHLLYVRFLALALHDMKLLPFGKKDGAPAGEPFPTFRAHGLITKDGAKMSKSRGNVVNPDEYIRKFGVDAIRMYLAFLAPLEQGGDFRSEGISGLTRFLDRVHRYITEGRPGPETENGRRIMHRTIKKVGEDIVNLHHNTAISALMICLNGLEKEPAAKVIKETFVKLLAPFAPFMAEELWRVTLKHKKSVHIEAWPKYDQELLVASSINLVVQVNSKTRATISAPAGTTESQARELALGDAKVQAILGSQKPKRVIYVPGRLINIVV